MQDIIKKLRTVLRKSVSGEKSGSSGVSYLKNIIRQNATEIYETYDRIYELCIL